MRKTKFSALLVVILLSTFVVNAQCWVQPDCKQEVQVIGNLQNSNYNGSVCFEGAGTIKNSVNVNNWDYLSYSGSLIVDGPLNMNNKHNVYANGSVLFDQVHFSGGDTLFISGAVIINKVVSNNSNPDGRNLIYLSEGSTVIINGHPYIGGQTVITPGNDKNEIDVKVCSSSTLPVKLESFTVQNQVASWKVGESSDVESYTIQGSNDSKNWTDIKTVDKDTYSYNLHNVKAASASGAWVFLGIVILAIVICRTRRKKALLLVGLVLLSYFSCTKSDKVQTPDTLNSYSYYRLSVNFTDGTAFYSPIVYNKN